MAESFDDFCRACLDLLKAKRTKYLIIGGVAVTAVGEPRFTADLDAIVFVELDDLERLLAYAIQRGFKADLDAELEAARAVLAICWMQKGSSVVTRGRSTMPMSNGRCARCVIWPKITVSSCGGALWSIRRAARPDGAVNPGAAARAP